LQLKYVCKGLPPGEIARTVDDRFQHLGGGTVTNTQGHKHWQLDAVESTSLPVLHNESHNVMNLVYLAPFFLGSLFAFALMS
jgi:hypothetical protein